MRLKNQSASNRSMASKQRAGPDEECSAIDKIEESVVDEEFEEMKGEI